MLGASHCKQAKDYVDIPWKPGMYLAPNIINRSDSGEQEHMKTYENNWKHVNMISLNGLVCGKIYGKTLFLMGKSMVSGVNFPLNQSIESSLLNDKLYPCVHRTSPGFGMVPLSKSPRIPGEAEHLENEELRGGPMEVGDRSNIPGKLSQFAMENHHFT